MKKETKAQRVERIKKEKDGLDVIDTIYTIAKDGTPIDPEDIDRLKWYGMYTQNRNLQDSDDDTLYLMLRIKIEQGRLNATQLAVLAEISEKYARGSADLTTRQNLQFHFIKLQDLVVIFEKLDSCALSSVMAAGDVVRNTVTCALGAKSADSLVDVSDTIDEINRFFYKNRDYSNLPRKFKIGVSGCSCHCMPHEIQDISFVAYRDAQSSIKFALYVGGGLASNKRFASYLGSVEKEQILPLTKACVEIFKHHGNREKRTKARVGHIVQLWGEDKFKETLESIASTKIERLDEPELTRHANRHHNGKSRSALAARTHIGCTLFGGKMGSQMLKDLSALMKKYDITDLQTTTRQSFILCDVVDDVVDRLEKDLESINIDSKASAFRVHHQACTGADYCKFAITYTKQLSEDIALHLEQSFPDFQEPITISVNGCPNSCAHPNVVMLGLQGASFKRDGVSVKGFSLMVAGKLDSSSSLFAKKTDIKLMPEEVPEYLKSLVSEYKQSSFRSFEEFLSSSFDLSS